MVMDLASGEAIVVGKMPRRRFGLCGLARWSEMNEGRERR